MRLSPCRSQLTKTISQSISPVHHFSLRLTSQRSGDGMFRLGNADAGFLAEVLLCEFDMGIGFLQQRFRASLESIAHARTHTQKMHISWMSKCFRLVTWGWCKALASLTDAGVCKHSGLWICGMFSFPRTSPVLHSAPLRRFFGVTGRFWLRSGHILGRTFCPESEEARSS